MIQSIQGTNLQNRLAEYGRIVKTCRSSGKSVKSWCDENNISQSRYYRMQHKVYEATASAEETEIVQIITKTKKESSPAATIRNGSMEADIYSGTDEETIRNICKALKSC